jgi:hypothetical protein
MSTTTTPGGSGFSTQGGGSSLSGGTQDARAKASELAADGRDALRQGAESAKDTARSVAGNLRSEASSFASGATEKARSLAEDQKNAGAERLSTIASAVDRAAGDLEEASPHTARLIRQAAAKVEDLSSTLQNRSVEDLVDSARYYARRQPLAVFGGAVIAGVLLSRFLKSTAEPTYEGAGSYPPPAPRPTNVGTPRNDWSSTGTTGSGLVGSGSGLGGTGSSFGGTGTGLAGGTDPDRKIGDSVSPTGRDPLSDATPQPSDFGTVSGGTRNGI